MNPLKEVWRLISRRRLISNLYCGSRDFSQLGEQRVLLNILERMDCARLPRTYLDIGAFHPTRGSNTFGLYQQGWRGVVVDPNPEKMRKFQRVRRDDLCLAEAVIPDSWTMQRVTMVAAHARDARESIKPEHNPNHRTSGSTFSYSAPVIRISRLLEYCHDQIGVPTVMSLDIEGLEWNLVRDIDFSKYPIPLLCIEHFLSDFDGGLSATGYVRSPMVRYLEANAYHLVSICGVSLVFARADCYVPFA